jgi:Lrp/AsnC family transcriptional regulator, leucine-responsive regulatory protein
VRGGRGARTRPPRFAPPGAAAARTTSTTTTTAATSTTSNATAALPRTSWAPVARPRSPSQYDRGDTRGAASAAHPRTGTENAIDAVDRRLIELLRDNGRASYAELARQVGLSSPAVHERVGKLEAAGVITGYRAVVDPAKIGLDVTALVGVIESDAVDDTGVEEALRALPQVEDCWRVAGSEGYVLKVRVTDIPALEATISALNRVRGVARTRTTVVLSTKWEGRHG